MNAQDKIQQLQKRIAAGLPTNAAPDPYEAAGDYPYLDEQGLPIVPPDRRICPTCGGLGQVIINAPGHERHNERIKCPAHTCPVTRRWALDRAERLTARHRAQFDSLYAGLTFESWHEQLTDNQKSGKDLAASVAAFFCENYRQPFYLHEPLENLLQRVERRPAPGQFTADNGKIELMFPDKTLLNIPDSFGNWLVLSGAYGVGKTGLSMAIANDLKSRGVFVAYIHLPTYLEDWQDTYNMSRESQAEAQEALKAPLYDADVLIVDEANVQEGAGGLASEDKTRLFFNHVIHPRHAARYDKPVILTTNKSAVVSSKKGGESDFQTHWGARLAERVYERSHWIVLSGAALRHRNQPVQAF